MKLPLHQGRDGGGVVEVGQGTASDTSKSQETLEPLLHNTPSNPVNNNIVGWPIESRRYKSVGMGGG